MEEFFTRQKANQGKKLPLFTPEGAKTEHYFKLLGVDSDVFRKAEVEAKREAMEVLELFKEDKDAEKRNEALAHLSRKTLASAVVEWSFEQELTIDNVANFFKEAPQIYDAVNRFVGNRELFFAKELKSSANGSKEK